MSIYASIIEHYDQNNVIMIRDTKDQALLDLLSANSRTSTAELARELDLSRTTVTNRLARLEQKGIIAAYTLRLGTGYQRGRVRAQVMISIDPKLSAKVTQALKKIRAIRSLHTVNGKHDLLAKVSSESTHDLDKVLDAIGSTEGINKTTSSIILSTKFRRWVAILLVCLMVSRLIRFASVVVPSLD